MLNKMLQWANNVAAFAETPDEFGKAFVITGE